MILDQDVVKIWGRKNLHKATIEQANLLPISAADRKFLIEIGLPDVEHLLLTFDLTKPFLSLAETVTSRDTPKELRRLWVIGAEDGQPSICLDENRNGAVLSVDSSRKDTRYINSGVREFGHFLAIHKRDYLDNPQVPKLSEVEVLPIIEGIENEYRNLDRSALSDPENWWCVILEQMRDGLL